RSSASCKRRFRSLGDAHSFKDKTMESPPIDPSLNRRKVLGIRGQLFIAFGGVFAILLASYFFAIATDEHFVQISEQITKDDLDSITAARDMRDAVDQFAETAGQSHREG